MPCFSLFFFFWLPLECALGTTPYVALPLYMTISNTIAPPLFLLATVNIGANPALAWRF
jgi:hypothetical protein